MRCHRSRSRLSKGRTINGANGKNETYAKLAQRPLDLAARES